ncbi:MAG TPA: gephyrin-like molybdotransferase Glp [Actinomycetota bacterium]|nr:gephyrin-like molybdotransferase Glp [Actinomycetota bacterium]
METAPLSLDEGRRRILADVPTLQPIELPLAETHGCVLAREVVTEYDIPPFSAALVDGFAVRAADIHAATADAPVALRVAGWALSGRAPEATVGWGEAVRIAAGAPMPAGADSVVPLEQAEADADTATVSSPVEPRAHVRPAGEDLRAGSVLVPAGRRLSAPELGLLATAGHGTVLVFPHLRVSVVAAGPTLVEPGRPAVFGQVRDAISYALIAGLREVGAVPYRIPIVQDVAGQLREVLLSDLSRADAFICAGDVLTDEGDAMSVVLSGLGEVTTYRTAMHPGGTVGFGIVDGRPFFTLPGEPVAAFVGFETFVRPAILKTMGRRDVQRPEVRAVLDEGITGPSGVTLAVPARVAHRDGAWHATPMGAAGLGALVRANGLVFVPPGDTALAPGEQVRVQVFRSLER